jgi:hypothetical protein
MVAMYRRTVAGFFPVTSGAEEDDNRTSLCSGHSNFVTIRSAKRGYRMMSSRHVSWHCLGKPDTGELRNDRVQYIITGFAGDIKPRGRHWRTRGIRKAHRRD